MDTIDVKLKLNEKLPEEVITNIRTLEWIRNFRIENGLHCRFIISFPKYFYPKSNAYLVETQNQVNMVLEAVYNIFKKYDIREAYTKRIDYPFTYIMPTGRTFNSYFQLFKLVDLIKNENFKGNGKFYGRLSTEVKESFTITNTLNIHAYSKKVFVYNQALKIKETKNADYQETLEKFPDLIDRMRVEVSFKEDINLLGDDGFYLDLGSIKRRYASYLANHIFNKNKINEGIQNQIDLLVDYLKEKYIQKNSDSKNRINWSKIFSVILYKPNYVFSIEIFNKAINEIYTSSRSKEDARKRIRDLSKEAEVSYEYIVKDMNAIMLSVLEQSKKI